MSSGGMYKMFIHPLKFKFDIIPGYYMNNQSEIYSTKSNKVLRPFLNKERKYVISLLVDGKKRAIRLDYLVISTFNMYNNDIIRVIHIDDNNLNCNVNNLTVLRKVDIINKYKDMYNVESLEEIKEEWKIYLKIPSIEVSNFGDVRNITNKVLIKTYKDHGYILFKYNNNHYFVHRLVAELFVKNPNPDKYHFVNHIDGIKDHNEFWNLEWCNISMNTEHAVLSGLNITYDEKTIRNVCQLLSQGLSHIQIHNITGVSRKYISDIYRGRRQKKISSEYSFSRKIPLSDLYNKDAMIALIKSGYKPKEISSLLKIDYSQSFISYYERLKRELKK